MTALIKVSRSANGWVADFNGVKVTLRVFLSLHRESRSARMAEAIIFLSTLHGSIRKPSADRTGSTTFGSGAFGRISRFFFLAMPSPYSTSCTCAMVWKHTRKHGRPCFPS